MLIKMAVIMVMVMVMEVVVMTIRILETIITNDNDNYNGFFPFVEEIYNNCKKLEISPSIITSWIKDLIDCQNMITDFNDKVFEVDSDDIIKQPSTLTKEKEQVQEKNLNGFVERPINKEIIEKHSNLKDNYDEKIKTDSYIETLTSETIVPFVSQVSFFISEKKKEIDKLYNHQKAIEKNLKYLKEQENKTKNDLDTIIQKEKIALSYINWFSNLEQSLLQNYNINIKQDIQSFCQLINDFKEKGYDADDIIQEYQKYTLLKVELKTNEDKIQLLLNQKGQLTQQVSFLESQINQHRLTLDIYSHLEGMGFGLKELKRLWDLIGEIAEANQIDLRDAVPKFFKDIEGQYHIKLGFEIEINEKRGEFAFINRELNNGRQNLFLNPSIGQSLSNLFKRE